MTDRHSAEAILQLVGGDLKAADLGDLKANLEALPTLETGAEGSQLKIATDDTRVFLMGTMALIQTFKVPPGGGTRRWFLTRALDLRGPIFDPETFESREAET